MAKKGLPFFLVGDPGLQRSTHRSVKELAADIKAWVE
jgi:hypothetical protein